MRWAIVATCLLVVLGSPAFSAQKNKGKEKEKTLEQKIQGKWARTNDKWLWVIEGRKWTQFKETIIDKPAATGTIEFPINKPYAVVTEASGWKHQVWPIGETAIAIETFRPGGEISGLGRIFYRPGQ